MGEVAFGGADELKAATGTSPVGETYFDIPSEPLGNALAAFSAATGIRLFYESRLIAGRSYSPVRGAHRPEHALELLLEGSGITAKTFDVGILTLLAKSDDQGDDLTTEKVRAAKFLPYFASLLRALRLALCRSPETEVDSAEIRVRLWIAASGTVSDAEVLSSTEHQQAYLQALRAMFIEEPSPQDIDAANLAVVGVPLAIEICFKVLCNFRRTAFASHYVAPAMEGAENLNFEATTRAAPIASSIRFGVLCSFISDSKRPRSVRPDHDQPHWRPRIR